MRKTRLKNKFFQRDILDVAPELLGKFLVRKFEDGSIIKLEINEIEIYRGEEDLASHASKGRTNRTEVMYKSGGLIYVYLIYGIYWMINIVTEQNNIPQAILIRGAGKYDGPGKLSQFLKIDKSFYGEDLETSERIWIEGEKKTIVFVSTTRIGIDYAGDYWKNKNWRYLLKK